MDTAKFMMTMMTMKGMSNDFYIGSLVRLSFFWMRTTWPSKPLLLRILVANLVPSSKARSYEFRSVLAFVAMPGAPKAPTVASCY